MNTIITAEQNGVTKDYSKDEYFVLLFENLKANFLSTITLSKQLQTVGALKNEYLEFVKYEFNKVSNWELVLYTQYHQIRKRKVFKENFIITDLDKNVYELEKNTPTRDTTFYKSILSNIKKIEGVCNAEILYSKVKEKADKKILKSYNINEFKTSFNCGFFNQRIDLEKQKVVKPYFRDWFNVAEKNYSETVSFGNHKDLIFTYNKNLLFLSQKIVRLYQSIYSFLDTEEIGYLTKTVLQKDEILRSFKILDSYSNKIKKQTIKSTDDELIKVREYCLSQLNEVVSSLFNIYTIDIEKSPFKDELKTLRKNLQKSISKDLIAKSFNTIQPTKVKNTNKVKKSIFDFFHNVKDKNIFIQELKNTFPNDKGKPIKAVLNILIEEKILVIIAGQFKAFYDLLSTEFNGTIGSYTSINDADKGTNIINDGIKNPVKQKLNPLIIKHKIQT